MIHRFGTIFDDHVLLFFIKRIVIKVLEKMWSHDGVRGGSVVASWVMDDIVQYIRRLNCHVIVPSHSCRPDAQLISKQVSWLLSIAGAPIYTLTLNRSKWYISWPNSDELWAKAPTAPRASLFTTFVHSLWLTVICCNLSRICLNLCKRRQNLKCKF